MKLLRVLQIAFSACVAASLCACAIPRYDVTVCLSPKLKDQYRIYPSLEVDVIGVNINESERFSTCPVDDYFKAGNPLRDATEHVTLYFSDGNIENKEISSDDRVWQVFNAKNADELLLIVNLPTLEQGKSSAKDSRKLLIPLEKTGMFGNKERFFELTPFGINQIETLPEREIPLSNQE